MSAAPKQFINRTSRRWQALPRRWRVACYVLVSFALCLAVLDRLNPITLDPPDESSIVLAEDGTPLRAYPSADGVWRHKVNAAEVSPYYIAALIQYEDRYFNVHPGVNPAALVRGAYQWISNGHIVSGGSTLSMQVVRLIDGQNERTLWGKAKQSVRALQLEAHYSKAKILDYYLNYAPMGGMVEGVEMGARTYFGKPAKKLSHAEAAMLAVLPQSPTRNRPDREPARAQAMRDKVLARMQSSGTWSPEIVADAKMERIVAQPPANISAAWLAPLAAERAKSENKRGTKAMQVVQTTIDANLQARIESLLQDRVRSLPPKASIAALVMENDSMFVRAYVGSADMHDAERSGHVDMTRAVRSPGSALKPFLYAMALDDGLVHSESLLSDAPQNFGGYAPGNFQSTFSGPISVTEALQRSLNVPAVDILERTQPIRFASRLRAGGLRLRMDEGASPNLSLILGGGGTTLEELVGAYRAFAVNGMAGKPRLSKDAPIVQNRMMSEGAAWIIRDILEGGSHPDKPAGDITSRPPFAWKTGTSFGFRDAWAVGVTDRYTIGIWLGRPDGTPNPGYFGANSAAPLARDIAAILPRSPQIRASRPATVTPQAICWPLGLSREQTPQPLCHQTRQAWLLNQTAPPTMAERANTQGLREVVWQEDKTGLRLTPACMQGANAQEIEIARWPNLLQPWLVEPVLSQSKPPAYKVGCAPKQSAKAGLVMHGIQLGSVVRAAPKRMTANPVVRVSLTTPAPKRAESVDTILNLTISGASGNVLWLLNGKVLATTQPSAVMKLPITQDGTYRLTATDAAGKFTFVEFSARGFVG